MMREADRAQRALERMQAARRKLYANQDTTDAAERTEHITMVMLAEALAQMPEPTPAPTPVTTAAGAAGRGGPGHQPDRNIHLKNNRSAPKTQK